MVHVIKHSFYCKKIYWVWTKRPSILFSFDRNPSTKSATQSNVSRWPPGALGDLGGSPTVYNKMLRIYAIGIADLCLAVEKSQYRR